MGNIRLLDCTLRDGGYINDWNFGQDAIERTISGLENSGVDILEIGFLKDEKYDKNRTVYNEVEQLSRQISPKKLGVTYAAMIEVVNPLPLEKLDDCSENSVDLIRVIIWKRMLEDGFEYCKGIVKKGYKLSVQPARVDQYTEDEFVDMIRMFNTIDPFAFYIVDSFGTQTIETLMPYMKLADKYLNPEIAVGYHGHNNMMQAFDVAKGFCEMGLKRDLYIDASIYGIGRGAGNLNLELFAEYLNNFYGKQYNLKAILQVYDSSIKNIYNNCKWGYTLPYYLTAIKNCNPNYANYYDLELEISTEDIDEVLNNLSKEDKIIYSQEKANRYLKEHRKKTFKLAVIVPTHNRPYNVEYYINNVAEEYDNYGVDLIFFDSSNNDETKNVIENFGYKNIYFSHYDWDDSEKTIDNKVYSAARDYIDRYDYVWLCRDRSMPNLDSLYKELRKLKECKYDFAVIYPHYIDCHHYGTKDYTDCCKLFRDLCGEMTSLGSIVFSKNILKRLVEDHPVDMEKNYGLWIPISLFDYLASHKFKALFIVNDSFRYIPIYTTSFWIKSNTTLWLWSERWIKMISMLPSVYNSEKKDVLKFKNWTVSPFSKLLLLPTRAGGGIRINDVNRFKDSLQKVTNIPLWKFYILALIPPKVIQFYLNYPQALICRFSRWIYIKLFNPIKNFIADIKQSIRSAVTKRKRKSYSGKDYEQYKNCFKENRDIESYLLSGTKQGTDKPWVTIAVPTYQRVDLLKDALDSIVRQRKVDYLWEVIVVDNEDYDGKTNETQKYIESLEKPEILYYRNGKNLGVGGNLNRCIELARGEWICFLHDDDLLVIDFLQKIEKRISLLNNRRGKSLAYISGTPEIFIGKPMNEDIESKREIIKRQFSNLLKYDEGKMLRVYQHELVVTGSTGVVAPTTGTTIKKDVAIEFGGFNESLNISADLIFAYSIMKKYAVYRSVEILGYYRWYDNISKKKLLKIEEDLYDFREYAYQKNCWSKLLGFIFRQEHFATEVKGIISMAQLEYTENLFNKFNYIMEYYPNKFRRKLYKWVTKVYRCIQRLNAVKFKNI